jgi:Tol biopolymer transport system component
VGFSGIYTMRADGSGVTRVTSSATDWHELPKWSPDGKRIAFSRRDASYNQDIYVMNADGTGLTNITQSPGSTEMLTAWAR